MTGVAVWMPGLDGSATLGITSHDGEPPVFDDSIERALRVTVEVEYESRTVRLKVLNPGPLVELGAVPAEHHSEDLPHLGDTIRRGADRYDVALQVPALPREGDGKAVEITVTKTGAPR